jgi:hypothetical protein
MLAYLLSENTYMANFLERRYGEVRVLGILGSSSS